MMGNIKYWLVVSWFGTPRELSAVLVQQIIECKSTLYTPYYIKNGLEMLFSSSVICTVFYSHIYMTHVSPL
jgi:hypothetical protein